MIARSRWAYLMDVEGALVHGEQRAVPGSAEFLTALRRHGIPFKAFTNKSAHTPRELHEVLLGLGLDVPETAIWTSAQATARFLDAQRPRGSAYVVGESGLITALEGIGYRLTESDPDYVVLGETRGYDFTAITKAIRLIEGGARFLVTNPDEKVTGASGTLPSTGAVAALIERVTGLGPYYIGKPNPLMLRSALWELREHSENTVVIGDRMDTDVRSGLESGVSTVLVLSGLSDEHTAEHFPYRPSMVIRSLAELVDRIHDPFGAD